jgi:hypothetical protein
VGVDGAGVDVDGACVAAGVGFGLTTLSDGSAWLSTFADTAADGTSMTLPALGAAAAALLLPPPAAFPPTKASAKAHTMTAAAMAI